MKPSEMVAGKRYRIVVEGVPKRVMNGCTHMRLTEAGYETTIAHDDVVSVEEVVEPLPATAGSTGTDGAGVWWQCDGADSWRRITGTIVRSRLMRDAAHVLQPFTVRHVEPAKDET